jgi:Flp pilus assembly protein TadD
MVNLIRKTALLKCCSAFWLLVATNLSFAESWPFVDPEFGPNIYLGDEDLRLGRAHFVHGDYGLAENYFRRSTEITPQNGQAWVGLAASYDRLGRFDLAEEAYKKAARLVGRNYVLLNNHGYSYMLRGRYGEARRLLQQAAAMAPGNPTIENNLLILDSGQHYFVGNPHILFWPE